MIDGWQTMESAPKDGREILIYHPSNNEMFVEFADGDGDWCVAHQSDGKPIVLDGDETHWRPLPAPPVMDVAPQTH